MNDRAGNLNRIPDEVDILTFVTDRYRVLGLSDDPMDLFKEATRLRDRIDQHRSRARSAVAIGVIFLIVAFGGLLDAIRSSGADFVTTVVAVALVGIAWYLLDFGFRSEHRKRYRNLRSRNQRFDILGSGNFSKVFELVENGSYQLARISVSGTSASFTPVTQKPVEKYIVREAFQDAWLPSEILYDPQSISKGGSGIPEHIVIVWREGRLEARSSRGQWKRYYLWRFDPASAATLFDRATDIYRDKPIERIKARIAVIMVCDHFEECRRKGAEPTSQAKLSLMLAERFRAEADHLLVARKISEIDARRLGRISISGEVRSVDPADPRAGQNEKPESWFFQLLSGENDTILPHLRAHAIKDKPDLPTFYDN